MGGAVAVHVAKSQDLRNLGALIVVDVVEGTALSALQYMNAILAQRPQSFLTLDDAINWR